MTPTWESHAPPPQCVYFNMCSTSAPQRVRRFQMQTPAGEGSQRNPLTQGVSPWVILPPGDT